jgi:hypothetical protein
MEDPEKTGTDPSQRTDLNLLMGRWNQVMKGPRNMATTQQAATRSPCESSALCSTDATGSNSVGDVGTGTARH